MQGTHQRVSVCELVRLTKCLFLMFFRIIFLRIRSKTKRFCTFFCIKFPRFSSLAPAVLAELTRNNYVQDVPQSTSLWADASDEKFFRVFCIMVSRDFAQKTVIFQETLLTISRIFFARACGARGANYKYRCREMRPNVSVCKLCVYRSFLLNGLIVPSSLWFRSIFDNTSSRGALSFPTLQF